MVRWARGGRWRQGPRRPVLQDPPTDVTRALRSSLRRRGGPNDHRLFGPLAQPMTDRASKEGVLDLVSPTARRVQIFQPPRSWEDVSGGGDHVDCLVRGLDPTWPQRLPWPMAPGSGLPIPHFAVSMAAGAQRRRPYHRYHRGSSRHPRVGHLIFAEPVLRLRSRGSFHR